MTRKGFFEGLSRFFESAHQGLICTIPILYISSFIVLFLNTNWGPLPAFLETDLGQEVDTILRLIHTGTYKVLSPIVFISISYNIISRDLNLSKENLNPVIPVIIVFGCYYTIIPSNTIAEVSHYAGPTGLFAAMVLSVILSKSMVFLFNHKMFKLKLFYYDNDWGMTNTLRFIEPAIYLYGISGILVRIVRHLTFLEVFGTIRNWMIESFFRQTARFIGVILYEVVTHLLWFFGIHGTNFAVNFTDNTLSVSTAINYELAMAGQMPTEIFTKEFFDSFVFIGGAGATLCLIIALFVAKTEMRRFSSIKFSIFFSLFNINEIIIYGLPVVFELYFLIPFILTPVVLTLTTYCAMALNLVPLTVGEVFWTTPIIFSGYITTGSISGAILQCVNIIVGTVIYLPFVKLYSRKKEEENIRVAKKVLNEITYDYSGETSLVSRKDEIGFLARSIAKDIRLAIEKGINPMYMVYQPISDKEGCLVGVESLLRWDHRHYGFISPEAIISIANDADVINELGKWIIDTALCAKRKWLDMGMEDVYISINISPKQLADPAFGMYIVQTIKKYDLKPESVEIEITENSTIDNSEKTKELLKSVSAEGVKIAIDDFGMGHSSLLYIRNHNIKTVKIDGALIRDLPTNHSSFEIVSSISNLCNLLNLKVVAEFVETKEHVDLLSSVGCEIYQGYYFSKPLSEEEFISYAKNNEEKS